MQSQIYYRRKQENLQVKTSACKWTNGICRPWKSLQFIEKKEQFIFDELKWEMAYCIIMME